MELKRFKTAVQKRRRKTHGKDSIVNNGETMQINTSHKKNIRKS